MATFKEIFIGSLNAIILNLTNLNSKRLMVTLGVLYLCWRVMTFVPPSDFKPLLDPNIVFGAAVAAAMYWLKKESETPTNLKVGEITNGKKVVDNTNNDK